METTPAVILSGNIREPSARWSLNETALALTRSLGRRGVPVYRFHPDRSLSDLKSRYSIHSLCPNLYERPMDLVETLVDFADKAHARPVLFPASDGSAKFIAANEGLLAPHFALTCPSASCMATTQNKQALLKAAAATGIDIPQTYFPLTITEMKEIAGSISFPVVIKPLHSSDWKSRRVQAVLGRVKALKAEKPDQLVSFGERVLSLSTPFMVQEIIPGPDENLLTFIGYVGLDGRVLAGCVRKKLRQSPPDFGYCALTDTINAPQIMDLSARLLRALAYRGIACIEFKRDARSGKAMLVEINARAVRTSALAIAAGVDFPWIAYQDVIKPGSVQPVLAYRIPMRWIHLHDELAAAGQMILRKQLSFLEWVRGFHGKPLVAAEFSWDDMLPALLFWSQAPRKLCRRLWQRRQK